MVIIQSPQELGSILRKARKQLKLTQPQLALASGVGVRFIVELEAGKPTLQLAKVMQVLASLGGKIHIDGLFSSNSKGNAHDS